MKYASVLFLAAICIASCLEPETTSYENEEYVTTVRDICEPLLSDERLRCNRKIDRIKAIEEANSINRSQILGECAEDKTRM